MQDYHPLLTIGYGSRSIDEFVAEIERSGADYLVDVRSSPYSRFKPEFYGMHSLNDSRAPASGMCSWVASSVDGPKPRSLSTRWQG